jgi:hypothetical protein
MSKSIPLSCLLLASCSLLPGLQGPPSIGYGGLVPGSLQLAVGPTGDAGDVGIWFDALVEGTVRGVVRAELRRAGGTVAVWEAGSNLSQAESTPPGWLTFTIDEHDAIGRRGEPQFVVPAQAGEYVLAIRFENQHSVEHRFELVEVATTSGTELGLAPSHYLARVALSTVGTTAYQVEHDQILFTVPTDLAQTETRFDFLWCHGGELAEQVTREVTLGWLGFHQPLQLPVSVSAMPKDLKLRGLLARNGEWQVHVVHDGRYLTTCRLTVAAGRLAGPGRWGAELPCAPRADDGTARARAIATTITGYAPEPFRAREVKALHRSELVRAVKAALDERMDARGTAAVLGGGWGVEADKAADLTERDGHDRTAQIRAARRNQADNREIARTAESTVERLERRYRALVNRYGR